MWAGTVLSYLVLLTRQAHSMPLHEGSFLVIKYPVRQISDDLIFQTENYNVYSLRGPECCGFTAEDGWILSVETGCRSPSPPTLGTVLAVEIYESTTLLERTHLDTFVAGTDKVEGDLCLWGAFDQTVFSGLEYASTSARNYSVCVTSGLSWNLELSNLRVKITKTECNCDPVGSVSKLCDVDHACECKDGYIGKLCENPLTCFGVEVGQDDVCSGAGTCTAFDHCECEPGWDGVMCQECEEHRYGEACEECDCSRAGSISDDCDKYTGQCPCISVMYYDLKCDKKVQCNDVDFDHSGSCGGRGECLQTGSCLCDGAFDGIACASCVPGMFGVECDQSVPGSLSLTLMIIIGVVAFLIGITLVFFLIRNQENPSDIFCGVSPVKMIIFMWLLIICTTAPVVIFIDKLPQGLFDAFAVIIPVFLGGVLSFCFTVWKDNDDQSDDDKDEYIEPLVDDRVPAVAPRHQNDPEPQMPQEIENRVAVDENKQDDAGCDEGMPKNDGVPTRRDSHIIDELKCNDNQNGGSDDNGYVVLFREKSIIPGKSGKSKPIHQTV